MKDSSFYCPFDGIKLKEENLGFLFCTKCKRWYLISWPVKDRCNFQQIYQEKENESVSSKSN